MSAQTERRLQAGDVDASPAALPHPAWCDRALCVTFDESDGTTVLAHSAVLLHEVDPPRLRAGRWRQDERMVEIREMTTWRYTGHSWAEAGNWSGPRVYVDDVDDGLTPDQAARMAVAFAAAASRVAEVVVTVAALSSDSGGSSGPPSVVSEARASSEDAAGGAGATT